MKTGKLRIGITCFMVCLASFMALETALTALDRSFGTAEAAVRIGYQEGNILPASARDEDIYILRSYNGFAAVFTENGTEPVLMTDIELESLRENDRRLIEAGIRVRGETEILKLIEDFNS